jgi:hypothetical protein
MEQWQLDRLLERLDIIVGRLDAMVVVLNSRIKNESGAPASARTSTNPLGADLFDDFWDAYPRKVGKGAARRAWRKIKRPAETLELIMAALEWQVRSADWIKESGEFVPHPATYLNGERWLDEPPQ